jgi:hypothetical protein
MHAACMHACLCSYVYVVVHVCTCVCKQDRRSSRRGRFCMHATCIHVFAHVSVFVYICICVYVNKIVPLQRQSFSLIFALSVCVFMCMCFGTCLCVCFGPYMHVYVMKVYRSLLCGDRENGIMCMCMSLLPWTWHMFRAECSAHVILIRVYALVCFFSTSHGSRAHCLQQMHKFIAKLVILVSIGLTHLTYHIHF